MLFELFVLVIVFLSHAELQEDILSYWYQDQLVPSTRLTILSSPEWYESTTPPTLSICIDSRIDDSNISISQFTAIRKA